MIAARARRGRARRDTARVDAYAAQPPFPHTPADIARIEAIRIRRLVSHAGDLSLRGLDRHLDTTAVAIETTMRDRAGLPHWIRELDAPTEYRNTPPWTYCPHTTDCALCATALAADLPPATSVGQLRIALDRLQAPFHPWLIRAMNWIAHRLDELIAWRIRRGGRP